MTQEHLTKIFNTLSDIPVEGWTRTVGADLDTLSNIDGDLWERDNNSASDLPPGPWRKL